MKLAYSHLSERKTSFCSNDNMPTKRIRTEYDMISGRALAYAMFEFGMVGVPAFWVSALSSILPLVIKAMVGTWLTLLNAVS